MAGIPKHEYSNPAVPCSVKTHLAKFNIELGCSFCGNILKLLFLNL